MASAYESVVGITVDAQPEGRFLVSLDATTRQLQLTPSLLTSPGEYQIGVTVKTASGDEYQMEIRAAVQTPALLPRTSQPPVVLLNGYQLPCLLASTQSSGTFGLMENQLTTVSLTPVRFFNNCVEGGQLSIEALGRRLGEYLDSLRYEDLSPVPQVDVVAHSMGGLIVRSYLSGKTASPGVFNPPGVPRIRKFIMIGTPNFGASFGGGITLDTQAAEMLPASQFIWDLATWNQGQDDLRGVDALAIIGNAGLDPSADDGLVPVLSAMLPQGANLPLNRTRVVPYCHTGAAALFCSGNARLLAYIDNPGHLSWRIVDSFLQGTLDWTTIGSAPWQDPWVSTRAGIMFSYADNLGRYYAPQTQLAADLLDINSGQRLGFFLGGGGSVAVMNGSVPKRNYKLNLSIEQTSFSLPLDLTNEYGYSVLPLRLLPFVSRVESTSLSGPGLTVTSGGPLTISGVGLISPNVPTNVYADSQPLTITSIADDQITAFLPSRPGGLMRLTVSNGYGVHTVNVVTKPPDVPILSLSKTELQFAQMTGNSESVSQTITISNTGSGTFLWSASANASWVALNSAPGLLTISTKAVDLAPGTYRAIVSVTADGASNSPQDVSITLSVTAGHLTISSSSISFSAHQGASSQRVSISGGASALPFNASVADTTPWLSVSSATGTTPSQIVVMADPTGLAPGSYSGQVKVTSSLASNSPTLTVNLTVEGAQSTAPSITSVVNGATFQSGIQGNSWVTIRGSNLAQTTRAWGEGDFAGNRLPVNLDGVSATVNGKPAVVYYISPTQINILAPTDTAVGTVPVTVTTDTGSSPPFSVELQRYSPGLFTFDSAGGPYVSATHLDGTYLGPAGLFGSTVTTQPARPGEMVVLYGTGFGPTNPSVPSDQIFSGAAPTTDTVSITIGGTPANVSFAGMTGNGLYQFNVTVPPLATGDHEVLAVVGGVPSAASVYMAVQSN